jgi:hypothetical protein
MTQDFLRRVDGYNFPFFAYDFDAALARNAAITISAPPGPGRIEAGFFVVDDVDVATARNNTVVITVDGVVIFTGALYNYLGIVESFVTTPWCSRYTSPTLSIFHWLTDIDYESTTVIEFYNSTSPDPSLFRAAVFGRSGM